MSVLRAVALASMLTASLAVADANAPAARKSPDPALTFDAGTTAGNATGTAGTGDPAPEAESLLSRIPEPGTLGLIAAGLAVMVFVARRRPRD